MMLHVAKKRCKAMTTNWHPRLRLQRSDGKGNNSMLPKCCVTYDHSSARVAAPLDVRLHLLDVPVVSRRVRRVNEAHQSGRTIRGGSCRKTCQDNIQGHNACSQQTPKEEMGCGPICFELP